MLRTLRRLLHRISTQQALCYLFDKEAGSSRKVELDTGQWHVEFGFVADRGQVSRVYLGLDGSQ